MIREIVTRSPWIAVATSRYRAFAGATCAAARDRRFKKEKSADKSAHPKELCYIQQRMQRLAAILFIALSLLASGCSTSLFKVKPVTELPALPENSRSADVGGISIRVAPLLTDEESQDLFEANLPLSGVLPVRTELIHQSGLPVELKKARFRLQDSQGRVWKQLSTKQAVARIMSANEVFAYNPNSKKQFEKEFGSYRIDLKTPLSNADRRRQGFLFFQTPDKRPVEFSHKLTLVIERLPETVSVAIN